MSEKPKKPTPAQILAPDVQVAGYTVRPWSFGALCAVSPYLDEIVAVAIDLDIDLDRLFAKVLGTDKQAAGYDVPRGLLLRLVARTLPAIAEIVAASVDELDLEAVHDMPPGKVATLLLNVFSVNVGTVTDFFGDAGAQPAKTTAGRSQNASRRSSRRGTNTKKS